MSQSAVEALFTERWDDVVGLVQAYREFEEKAVDVFETKAGPTVRTWLLERGFELEIDAKYGEYRAYRSKWLNSDGEPVVKLSVGGLFPKGLAKVDGDAPYLWVYLKLDQPARSQVADELTRLAGPTWLDAEVRERQPLGRYLRKDNVDRLQLVRDSQIMADFAIAAFPELLALEDVIAKALPSIASGS